MNNLVQLFLNFDPNKNELDAILVNEINDASVYYSTKFEDNTRHIKILANSERVASFAKDDLEIDIKEPLIMIIFDQLHENSRSIYYDMTGKKVGERIYKI